MSQITVEHRDALLESVIPFIRSQVKGDDDLFQTTCLFMLKYLHRYDPDKGSLTTFTGYVIRSSRKYKMYPGINLPLRNLEDKPSVGYLNVDVPETESIDVKLEVLGEFERTLVYEHICDGVSMRDLALKYYESRYRIKTIIEDSLERLRDAES